MIITHYFGIPQDPFNLPQRPLLSQQNEIFEILLTHCDQGGLCLIAGEPGSGKTVLKEALIDHEPRDFVKACIGRTLHTYYNTLHILCQAFQIEDKGAHIKCEKALIEETFRLNHLGKRILILIDEAHLLDIACLRKLRLLLAEFPKNHNLILFGQADLLGKIQLGVNEDIRSRITYSALLRKLTDESIRDFILQQFDRAGLAHNTLGEDALALIARSSQGVLRNAVHLTRSSLIQAARSNTRIVGLKHVNHVLLQPHWRRYEDIIATDEQRVAL